MALATPDDVRAYGYDVELVSPLLNRAELRVRGYLARRASATAVLNAGEAPDTLKEIIVAIANRMASTSSQVVQGVVSEGSGGESVSFGAQAFAGTSDLTDAEKKRLDTLYPRSIASLETFK